MLNRVSFSLEDGKTLICPDTALLVFVDDTGHEGLRNAQSPFFGYGGCITTVTDYAHTIVKPWKHVENVFPRDMVPLHASELKPSSLTSVHFTALNDFFANNVFGRFAAICTDKTINTRPELETMNYMAIAAHLRMLEILRAIVNNGITFSEIFMFIEKSERTQQQTTEYFSQMELRFDTQKIPIHHYFMTKAPNEPGLVVADFIAHTAGTTVRSKHRGRATQYLVRPDFKSVFAPKDERWVAFEEVNEIK